MNTKKGLLALLWSKLKAESEKHKANETLEENVLSVLLWRLPRRPCALSPLAPRNDGEKRKEYVIVLLSILAVLLQLLITIHAATAQEQQSAGLQIGDKVPDVTITHIINYKTPTAKLSDFKGKLLILDFWATSCLSCIKEIPKLDSLQQQFAGRVTILPVSYEKRQHVQVALQKNKMLQKMKLPTVIEDVRLKQLFPHKIISHEVWIDGTGTVRAITDPQYVNAENIQAILDGKEVNWPVKNDQLAYDYHKPLFPASGSVPAPHPVYYSMLKSYMNGVATKFGVERDSIHGTVRTYVINFPVLKLYMMALGYFAYWPKTQIIWDVKDRSRYIFNEKKDYRSTWNSQNCYCYESVLPITVSNRERVRGIRQDLNRFLGLNGRMETRRVKCLVLVRTGPENRMGTRGGTPENTLSDKDPVKRLRNTELSNLIWELNNLEGHPPAMDETGYTGKVDIDLKINSFSDTAALRAALHPYGLDLKEAERAVEFFVLSDRKASEPQAAANANRIK